MRKKMDLNSFNVLNYIKENVQGNFGDTEYILADNDTYRSASIRFPFRNFFYGLGVISAGSGTFRIACTDYPVKKGSLILIGPGIVSQWMSEYTAEVDTILFAEKFMQGIMGSSTILHTLPYFLPGANHVIDLNDACYDKMMELFSVLKKFREDKELARGITYSLLMLANKAYDVNASDSKATHQQKIAREFRSLVARHFLIRKDVSYYAESLNISPKYLSEILVTETGRSAKTLIDDAVFLEAKSLLKQTNMSVQQICVHLGYADTSYFTKAFRKKEGITPLDFRRS